MANNMNSLISNTENLFVIQIENLVLLPETISSQKRSHNLYPRSGRDLY